MQTSASSKLYCTYFGYKKEINLVKQVNKILYDSLFHNTTILNHSPLSKMLLAGIKSSIMLPGISTICCCTVVTLC